jgi:hypothetical protein
LERIFFFVYLKYKLKINKMENKETLEEVAKNWCGKS